MLSEIIPNDRFEVWLKELDEMCFGELGLRFRAWPDQTYCISFNEGYSSEDAFYELAENSYFGVEFTTNQASFRSTYIQEFDSFSD